MSVRDGEVYIPREGTATVSLNELNPEMRKALIVPFVMIEEFVSNTDNMRKDIYALRQLLDGYIILSNKSHHKAAAERACIRRWLIAAACVNALFWWLAMVL